jgi:hypothetical protein
VCDSDQFHPASQKVGFTTNILLFNTSIIWHITIKLVETCNCKREGSMRNFEHTDELVAYYYRNPILRTNSRTGGAYHDIIVNRNYTKAWREKWDIFRHSSIHGGKNKLGTSSNSTLLNPTA